MQFSTIVRSKVKIQYLYYSQAMNCMNGCAMKTTLMASYMGTIEDAGQCTVDVTITDDFFIPFTIYYEFTNCILPLISCQFHCKDYILNEPMETGYCDFYDQFNF
uniref:Uncharacterized protein n=1 Tax=Rhizophagus irregularis (strain DAOM 181602 / DAOM 197198 / MUCL 43194) TaxID=747089 RepID=U9T1B9_RHIID